MKVVILCGGMGTRMKEETEFKPKPLVHVGNKPILYHIMKIYGHYGFTDFVLCLGYKGEMIKEYFLNYDHMNNDFTIDLDGKKNIVFYDSHRESDWTVTLADTGISTNTGGRIKQVEKYVEDEAFLATYGDGVADIDLARLLRHHEKKGKLATLTGVHPLSRYGVIKHDEDDLICGFKEKPRLDGWINAGFFVFNREFFDYIGADDILEKEPLERLSKDEQLTLYKHRGFWQCMDTFKDASLLNNMWAQGEAPWKVWADG